MSQLMLAPATVDLEIYQGDGVSIQITATDASGAAMNVTGTTIAYIRQNRTDTGTPTLAFTVDTTNAATGILLLSLTGAQTATLSSGTNDPWRGFWDVQWTVGGGQPLTLVKGKVACDQDVSHS